MSLKPALYQEVTLGMFQDAFKQSAPDNFTKDGLELVFLHLQSIAEEPRKLDIADICQTYEEVTAETLIAEKDIEGIEPDDFRALQQYLWDEEVYVGSMLDRKTDELRFIILIK